MRSYSVHAYRTLIPQPKDLSPAAELVVGDYFISCDGHLITALDDGYFASAKDAIHYAKRFVAVTGYDASVCCDSRHYLRIKADSYSLLPFSHFYLGRESWAYRALRAWTKRILG